MSTVKQKIIQFWNWFAENRTQLEQMIDANEPDYASLAAGSQLEALRLPIFCEAGLRNGAYTLSLCPCGDKTAQFTARFWQWLAPAYKNWRFSAFHQPEYDPPHSLLRLLGSEHDPTAFTFYCTADEKAQKYCLCVVSPSFAEHTQEENAAFCRLLFYLLLGEAITEIYIDEIDCRSEAPQAQQPPLRLTEFTQLMRQLPTLHAWPWVNDPTAMCFGYQPASEPTDLPRGDITGGFTRHPQLLSFPFETAEQLRLRGGSFCYLYYPVAEANPIAETLRRNERGSQIEHFLQLYSLGYVLGNAFGTRYNYIDLIIFEEPVFRAVFFDLEETLGITFNLGYFGRTDEKIQ